jgi:hypothetical protein
MVKSASRLPIARHFLELCEGGRISLGFVPEALKQQYGSGANIGLGVFFTLRPAVGET